MIRESYLYREIHEQPKILNDLLKQDPGDVERLARLHDRAAGVVPVLSDLDRVHAPIGLEIGAETPEEIAVSIVAELIQVRAGKEA